MNLNKVVIPAAGLGTRLLSITKEIPKEMLPLYIMDSKSTICLKPIVQIIFEQLFKTGLREFCFIVGRGKRTIEDHFAPDYRYVDKLRALGNTQPAKELEDFYKKIQESAIVWINQPEAKGFGKAVLLAKTFTNQEPFLVHAGDTYITSKNDEHLNHFTAIKEKEIAANLSLIQVKNTKHYGIAEVSGSTQPYRVKKVIEKPDIAPTNLALMPIYTFTENIYRALEETRPGKSNEIQLTDGIQKMIDWNQNVVAHDITGALHLDIGTPENYWKALEQSHRYLANKKNNI